MSRLSRVVAFSSLLNVPWGAKDNATSKAQGIKPPIVPTAKNPPPLGTLYSR